VITVGVDVGGTNIRAGVVDVEGTVLDTVRTPTPRTQDELQDAVAGAVAELARQHRVEAVGLAVAGFVAPDNRTVTFAPHLPWRDAPVAEYMERRLGLPVVVEHDTNAAALAEWRVGAGAGVNNLAYVAVGTGIGAALLVAGEPYRGEHGVAPELGHLRVVPDGRVCPCGKRGCWERYCSGTALAETAAELRGGSAGVDGHGLTGRDVALAAQSGDPVARAAVADLARWLGEGLALVADVFDPALVLIGGGVAESAALFLADAVAHYEGAVTGAPYRRLAEVRVARLGDAAGVVGAAVLARAHVRQRAWTAPCLEDGAVVLAVTVAAGRGSGPQPQHEPTNPAGQRNQPERDTERSRHPDDRRRDQQQQAEPQQHQPDDRQWPDARQRRRLRRHEMRVVRQRDVLVLRLGGRLGRRQWLGEQFLDLRRPLRDSALRVPHRDDLVECRGALLCAAGLSRAGAGADTAPGPARPAVTRLRQPVLRPPVVVTIAGQGHVAPPAREGCPAALRRRTNARLSSKILDASLSSVATW